MHFSDCWVRQGETANQNPNVWMVARGKTETLNEKSSANRRKKLQPKTLRIKINKGKSAGSVAEWKGSLKNLCHASFLHSFIYSGVKGCGKYKNERLDSCC